MAKRSRSAGGIAAGVDADEEQSKACRQRRRCSANSGNQLSRLSQDLVLEIAARLPSPSDARSLALASTELYSTIRPALSRMAFLTGYLRRGVPGAPQCPPGFFLSTSRKTCRHRRRGEDPAPDTVFVRGPRSILRGYNVVDPATFRAFLATAKRRRAHVVASSGHLLLLCEHGDDGATAGGGRYSVVNPATDVWVYLPHPPAGFQEAVAYAGCPAFHCTAGMELTVAYLARRRHDGHLAVHWFTSTSGRWRSMPTAARSYLQPTEAAACAGGTFYWMLLHAGGCFRSDHEAQEHAPCAVVAWNATKSWNVPCPMAAPRGLTMLREADGLLRYCHTTRCPYLNLYSSPCHGQTLDDVYLDVWTLEAPAKDSPATSPAGKWQLRILGDGDSADAHADEGADAEFWTRVLYNNIAAAATRGCRAEDVVAGHAYEVFRYSPGLTS